MPEGSRSVTNSAISAEGLFRNRDKGLLRRAAILSVQTILVCQRQGTILIQESHTQNRLNSESLRTDTLTKFSQQTVSGIRVTSFDSSSCLVNIAAR